MSCEEAKAEIIKESDADSTKATKEIPTVIISSDQLQKKNDTQPETKDKVETESFECGKEDTKAINQDDQTNVKKKETQNADHLIKESTEESPAEGKEASLSDDKEENEDTKKPCQTDESKDAVALKKCSSTEEKDDEKVENSSAVAEERKVCENQDNKSESTENLKNNLTCAEEKVEKTEEVSNSKSKNEEESIPNKKAVIDVEKEEDKICKVESEDTEKEVPANECNNKKEDAEESKKEELSVKDEIDEEVNKDDDEDDEEEEESEEELQPGLLERPVVILDSKRERKKSIKFSFLEQSLPTNSEKKKLVIPAGSGVELRDHPVVEDQLAKNPVADLKIIHRLFYGVGSDVRSCKNNLKSFTGFSFEKSSKDFQKKEEYLGKFTLANLKWTASVLDCHLSGKTKDQIIKSILEWCMCPKPSGKAVVGKKGKRKKKSSSVTNSKKIKATAETKKKSPNKPVVKKAPKKVTKNESNDSASSSKRKITSYLSNDIKSEKKMKKTSPPTDHQIREAVTDILDGADLESMTMKNVCCKVYELFPNHDITERKPFIKEVVREVISKT